MSLRRFDPLIGSIRKRMGALHDRRTGKKYTMEDIGLSAFTVFYTQSPSFLAAQKAMEENKGCHTATSHTASSAPNCPHARSSSSTSAR